MSETWDKICRLVIEGQVQISDHGYDELAADDLTVGEVLRGFSAGEVIEDYPDYPKGPCVLVLQ